MKEIYEFRIRERFMPLLSQPDVGTRLQFGPVQGSGYRLIKVTRDDPLFAEIGDLNAQLFASQREHLFHFWDIHRSYSSAEIESAQLFHLLIVHTFEPSGEECGTQYDDSVACHFCGAGGPQVTNLFLDSRKLPKAKDIARTIAGEIIASQRLANILQCARVSGVGFPPVYHKALFEEDSFDLSEVDSGRKLLTLAASQGVKQGSAAFYIWLNKPEVQPLLNEATRQYVRARQNSERASRRPLPTWHQLVVNSKPVAVAPSTSAGASPFENDPDETGRCERSDTIGIRWLSEISVLRADWDNSDVFLTKEFTGVRRGLLRPRSAILVLPRVREILVENRLRGARFEVAHFV